ncbi:MAG: 30S ribosomal protein S10 [Cytophagales bacterium]
MKKIRVKLKSFDHVVLETAAARISKTAIERGAIVNGPSPLPTKTEKFTLRRSPHANEDSRAQYEISTHKRLIDINLSSAPESTIEGLMKLDLPSNVKVEVDVYSKK